MGGVPGKPTRVDPSTRRQLDANGKAEMACRELADDLGWDFEVVWFWWWQLALVVEAECGLKRPVAECLSSWLIPQVFDVRGREAS